MELIGCSMIWLTRTMAELRGCPFCGEKDSLQVHDTPEVGDNGVTVICVVGKGERTTLRHTRRHNGHQIRKTQRHENQLEMVVREVGAYEGAHEVSEAGAVGDLQ